MTACSAFVAWADAVSILVILLGLRYNKDRSMRFFRKGGDAWERKEM